MNRRLFLALVLLVMAIGWPSAAFADGAAVKCGVNEERVWLYDSVTSFNIEAKLKCGENVEVIGHENGYVKVRTASGTEGYLPESNLPKLPVGAPAAAADSKQAAQPTLASVARAAAARRANSAAASEAAPNVAVAKMDGPGVAAIAAPAPQQKTVAAVAPTPAQATGPAGSVKTVSSTTTASIPATAQPAATASHAKPKPASKSSTTNTVTTSGKPAPANPPAPRSAASTPLHTAMATPAPKTAATQPAAVVATNDVYVGSAPTSAASPKAASVRTVSDTSEDDDDSYLTRPKSESEDPSCQMYFSGYGLSPGQFKWLADNRTKKYPSVCPAASPAMVDYVIIFTHDVDFFNYTMPTPIHTEAGGFTDWAPVLTYDTSVVSHSDIDKSRREYVWVFHVKRGAFDPGKFSPHRKFQYTKIESKYSRTVEDAFEFIETQRPNR